MTVLKRNVRGIRQKIPSGYILGRKSAGEGPAEMLAFSDVAKVLANTPGAASTITAALTYGLFASRPTAPNTPAGQLALYYATDVSTLYLYIGTGWVSVGGGGGGLFGGLMSATPPTKTNTGLSTWLNQGSAVETDVSGAGMAFVTPSNGSAISFRGLFKAAPATPYTVTILVAMNQDWIAATGSGGFGFGWYDGTAKLHVALVIPTNLTDVFRDGQYTNVSTLTNQANKDISVGNIVTTPYLWVQIKDDGTNISAKVSLDGANYNNVIAPIAKSSAWLGAAGYSKIIFGTETFDTQFQGTIMSYKETSP